MTRRLLAVVTLAGGAVAAIWLLLSGTVTPNRVATCEVALSPELVAQVRDAGFPRIGRSEVLSFGVRRDVLPDAGLDFTLPPAWPEGARVKDWTSDCVLAPCASAPALCVQAKFDSAQPFVLAKTARRCVRTKRDAGIGTCLLLDGGLSDNTCNDGCNILPAARFLNPSAPECERVPCDGPSGVSPLSDEAFEQE